MLEREKKRRIKKNEPRKENRNINEWNEKMKIVTLTWKALSALSP